MNEVWWRLTLSLRVTETTDFWHCECDQLSKSNWRTSYRPVKGFSLPPQQHWSTSCIISRSPVITCLLPCYLCLPLFTFFKSFWPIRSWDMHTVHALILSMCWYCPCAGAIDPTSKDLHSGILFCMGTWTGIWLFFFFFNPLTGIVICRPGCSRLSSSLSLGQDFCQQDAKLQVKVIYICIIYVYITIM